MKAVDYTDEHGRNYRVRLPDDVDDNEADRGIPIGPPDVVDKLGLPEPIATRLHNELHRRRLWTLHDLERRPRDITGALQAAYRVDAQRLMEAYHEWEHPQPLEEQGG